MWHKQYFYLLYPPRNIFTAFTLYTDITHADKHRCFNFKDALSLPLQDSGRGRLPSYWQYNMKNQLGRQLQGSSPRVASMSATQCAALCPKTSCRTSTASAADCHKCCSLKSVFKKADPCSSLSCVFRHT